MAGGVVVVGGGLAGVRTAQALRARGYDGALTVLAAEPGAPYDRPPLSKSVLRGEGPPPPLLGPGEDVGLRAGVRAVGLDVEGRRVLLEDGTLPYDELVVANGAVPRALPGLSGDGVHVLRTDDDAARLAAEMVEAGRLTVVGGGFVGCEAASSARALGLDVTVVEVLPLPLCRVLGERVAAEVVREHVAAGVDVRGGTSVVAVHGEGRDRVLQLSDGTTVPGWPVLVGVGVRPDTDWLAGSGLDVADGVVCDASGRAGEHERAVGDVARWWSPAAGAHRRVEHWTSAAEQADVVARGLLGEVVEHDAVPYVWSEQLGVTYQLVGAPAPDDDVTLLRVGEDRLLAVYGRDGRLTGALGGGAPRWVNRLRKALRTGSTYDEAVAAVQP